MQEDLENYLIPKQDRVDELSQILSYGLTDDIKRVKTEKENLEKEIDTDKGVIKQIITHISNNNKKIAELQKYVDAYTILQNGPPLHLCGEKFESFDGIEKEYENAPQPE
jgi:uncharacterized protein (UPF0305 family)